MNFLLFTEPSSFNPILHERFGALIKEKATGLVVDHIQELRGWGLVRHLAIAGGNPLAIATEVIEKGLDAVQVVQLENLRRMLHTVQSLATAGAVASVASLGVSVGGFAIVVSKLNRMDRKLDRLLGEIAQVRHLVQGLHVKLDALAIARLSSALEAVDLALDYEPVRRRETLQQAIKTLAELRHYYALLLSDPQFCSLGTDNLLALLDTHERLVAICNGELLAEFHLSGSAHLIEERWKRQKSQLDAAAWKTERELYELAEQGDRDAGVWIVTPPEVRRAKVEALNQVREESLNRLASIPRLARVLEKRGISAAEYVRELQDRSRNGDSLAVIDLRQ